jgi:hypothetical protein
MKTILCALAILILTFRPALAQDPKPDPRVEELEKQLKEAQATLAELQKKFDAMTSATPLPSHWDLPSRDLAPKVLGPSEEIPFGILTEDNVNPPSDVDDPAWNAEINNTPWYIDLRYQSTGIDGKEGMVSYPLIPPGMTLWYIPTNPGGTFTAFAYANIKNAKAGKRISGRGWKESDSWPEGGKHTIEKVHFLKTP